MATKSFEQSPVWTEVQDILKSTTPRFTYDVKGILHTAKEDVPVWELTSIETHRDYLNDIGEVKIVVFRVGLGDYINRVYPYRRNLEFTIKRLPYAMQDGSKAKDVKAVVVRYKGIFNPQNNPPVGASELETHSPSDLNLSDMVEVVLELVDRSLEPLRIRTTGGAWRKIKLGTLLQSLIGHESSNVLVDGKPAADGVDIVPPDNEEITNNVVIPHGTLLSSVPTYLQTKVRGVYGRGLGTFFQLYEGKRLWFIYPTHDTERFTQDGKKIAFYSVPQEKLPQLDKSYWVDGNLIKVAVTAQRRYSDTADLDYMNNGSGFRTPDANAFMKKPVKITEKGPRASRAKLNSESVIREREDGLNYAPTASASSNPYAQRSAVVVRSLAQLDLVWENAAPDLIYPGMPCKYVYLSQGKPVSLKGTILFVHALEARVERQNASTYRTTCRISIACQQQSKFPDLPEEKAVGNNP